MSGDLYAETLIGPVAIVEVKNIMNKRFYKLTVIFLLILLIAVPLLRLFAR